MWCLLHLSHLGFSKQETQVFTFSWGKTSDKVETRVNTKKHLALRPTGRTAS